MTKIKIMTDSASDLPKSLTDTWDITVIPIPITIDGKGYLEGLDFTPREFYPMLEAAKDLPTTSQIPAHVYFQHYQQCYKQGYDEIILVSLNAATSSTYLRALDGTTLFYEEYPEAKGKFPIHVIDSATFSIAYGYPTLEAAKMAKSGATVSEILAYLDDWFSCLEVYFSAFSLEYIKRSGRIGCTAAAVGEALGIRPILRIVDGKITTLQKVHGNNNVLKAFFRIAKERMAKGSPYGVLGGTFESMTEKMTHMLRQEFGYEPFGVFDVGCAIAINSGPKMLGIGFKGAKRHRK